MHSAKSLRSTFSHTIPIHNLCHCERQAERLEVQWASSSYTYEGYTGRLPPRGEWAERYTLEEKTAYEQVVNKDLEGELTEESKEDILAKLCDADFYKKMPHTFILLDETINILMQKKYRRLRQMVFRNRQED
jgi:hypothetical protein